MKLKLLSKTWITLCSLFTLLALPTSSSAQSNNDRCRVYIVNHKELDQDSPSGEKEEDGSPIPKGVKVLGRFSPKVAEEERTTKTFDFPGKKLKIIASVYYTDESMHTKLTWNSVQLAIMIADTEKRDASALVRDSFAEFPYLPYSKIKASSNLLTEEGIYSVVLECDVFKDENSAVEFQKEFCKPKSKSETEQKKAKQKKRNEQ